MDPIHPIVPLPPTIPPVTPAPLVGRIDREAARERAGEDKRQRRRPKPEHASSAHEDAPGDPLHQPDDMDDSGLHINVTA